ncbi:MAG TPA: hypothetical protein ENN81_09675 [Phycisphaerales bacterium]|nr:hypothetical protein [Phycisphaerales bacterium]
MKMLIIGLDGATWDVLDDYLLAHHMPNLMSLRTGGCSGTLRSTEPPITAASWTTFLTGCSPRIHGVIGWHEYRFDEDRLRISTSEQRLVPTMWQELSEQGYKIASINVPWTYPCAPINGIMAAGYGCPGPASEFVYPPEFKAELLDHIPDYEIMAQWRGQEDYTLSELDDNLKRVERSLEQKVEAAELICGKLAWDVLMVQFHDTDSMEHHIWSYLDKQSRGGFAQHRDRVFKTFEKLDEMIGRLLKLAGAEDSCVIVVSDHGLTRRKGKVRANVLLRDWGYLKPKGLIAQMMQRHQRKRFVASLGREAGAEKKRGIKQPRDYDFDWLSSKAMVIDVAINGHLYVNVKGRQPNGKVAPGPEYDEIIEDLTKRFSEVVHPATGEKMFTAVGTPEDIYGFQGDAWRKYGDLVLVPQIGYELVLGTSRTGEFLQMATDRSLKGYHSYNGIYIFCGKGIRAGAGGETAMIDMAPTIYAALGASLPSYMDGKVKADAFAEEKAVAYHESDVSAFQQVRAGLSETEEAEVAERLRALGYVE